MMKPKPIIIPVAISIDVPTNTRIMFVVIMPNIMLAPIANVMFPTVIHDALIHNMPVIIPSTIPYDNITPKKLNTTHHTVINSVVTLSAIHALGIKKIISIPTPNVVPVIMLIIMLNIALIAHPPITLHTMPHAMPIPPPIIAFSQSISMPAKAKTANNGPTISPGVTKM